MVSGSDGADIAHDACLNTTEAAKVPNTLWWGVC